MMEIGSTHRHEFTVTSDMTAKHMKSGALEVLATPVMIANMENCCFDLAAPHLEDGTSTVGTLVNISHLAATPVGNKVVITSKLKEIDRRRLVFDVTAEDETEVVGKGTHERFIVDIQKFMDKCAQKK